MRAATKVRGSDADNPLARLLPGFAYKLRPEWKAAIVLQTDILKTDWLDFVSGEVKNWKLLAEEMFRNYRSRGELRFCRSVLETPLNTHPHTHSYRCQRQKLWSWSLSTELCDKNALGSSGDKNCQLFRFLSFQTFSPDPFHCDIKLSFLMSSDMLMHCTIVTW